MGNYILINNPNLHLKKFLGKKGKSLTKIYPKRAGKIYLDGIELYAYSSNGDTIESGEEVLIIGISGRKLIVKSLVENSRGDDIYKNKITELEKKMYLNKLMDRLDDYLYGEITEEEFLDVLEELEFINEGEKMIKNLEKMAHDLEEEGDLKSAMEIYKRIEKLKKRSKK